MAYSGAEHAECRVPSRLRTGLFHCWLDWMTSKCDLTYLKLCQDNSICHIPWVLVADQGMCHEKIVRGCDCHSSPLLSWPEIKTTSERLLSCYLQLHIEGTRERCRLLGEMWNNIVCLLQTGQEEILWQYYGDEFWTSGFILQCWNVRLSISSDGALYGILWQAHCACCVCLIMPVKCNTSQHSQTCTCLQPTILK
jgi:hypothetical protein